MGSATRPGRPVARLAQLTPASMNFPAPIALPTAFDPSDGTPKGAGATLALPITHFPPSRILPVCRRKKLALDGENKHTGGVRKTRRIVIGTLLLAAVVGIVIITIHDQGGSEHRQGPKIAPGEDLLMVKTDGSLWAMRHWNPIFNPNESHSRPVRIGKERDWVAAASGASHSLALKSDGSLWAWGRNDTGQLGIGPNQPWQNQPVRVGQNNDWIKICAGGNYSLALKSNGTLWAWGENRMGQLGIGNTNDTSVPMQVGQDYDWTEVSAGLRHTLALKSDGSLWAWGQNGYGALGDGTSGQAIFSLFPRSAFWQFPEPEVSDFDVANKSTPVRIGTATDWRAISAGYYHSVGLKADGSLWTWGANFNGQLGDGSKNVKTVPTKVGVTNNWKMVGAGAYHTAALKQDGSLWAWGSNNKSQLGDGTMTNRLVPIQIGQATNWVWASGGTLYSVGLRTDGTLWLWGQKLHIESKSKLWLRWMLFKYKIPIHLIPFQPIQPTPIQIDKLGPLPLGQFSQAPINAPIRRNPEAAAKAGVQ